MATNPHTQRQMVEALRDPACYPHPVTRVTVIETHISFVLLTGRFAYKIKKAVDLGFVDYTELPRRQFFCAEELRLNRRLAPQIYLEVVPIGGTPQAPRCAGAGEALDYAVKMVEFAQDDLLDTLLAAGKLTSRHIDTLATALAAFHAAAPRLPPDATHASPHLIATQVAANFPVLQSHTEPQVASSLAALQDWCANAAGLLQASFAQRQETGWVRECHGDLHLGNIAILRDLPQVFDCIEFDPQLRWIDVINDLAFLVMDLSAHGRPDLAWRLLNGWLEGSGDFAGLGVLRFYEIYRALVRAKVASLQATDTSCPAAQRQAAQARISRYLSYATARMDVAPPALLLTHGFSGSGKTTLARTLAAALPAICLRSDVERKRLAGLAPLAASASALHAGLYAESATRATYAWLVEQARTVLHSGYSVVIDAACLRAWQREGFAELAREAGVPLRILACTAPHAVLLARIDARQAAGGDASEADRAVLARQMEDSDPLSAAEQAVTLTVATPCADLDRLVGELRRQLVKS